MFPLQHQYETHIVTALSLSACLSHISPLSYCNHSLSLSVFFTFLEHPVLSVLVFLYLSSANSSAKSSSCTQRVCVHGHVDMCRFSTYTCSGDQLSKYTQCCFVCLPSRAQVGHYLLANVLTRRPVLFTVQSLCSVLSMNLTVDINKLQCVIFTVTSLTMIKYIDAML